MPQKYQVANRISNKVANRISNKKYICTKNKAGKANSNRLFTHCLRR